MSTRWGDIPAVIGSEDRGFDTERAEIVIAWTCSLPDTDRRHIGLKQEGCRGCLGKRSLEKQAYFRRLDHKDVLLLHRGVSTRFGGLFQFGNLVYSFVIQSGYTRATRTGSETEKTGAQIMGGWGRTLWSRMFCGPLGGGHLPSVLTSMLA
jgi:hypothetical protein